MIIVFKQQGETPLACVQRTLDTKNNTYTYAGRLDPMAEGLLLVLENEECKKAKEYHNLNKTYEYTFLVGIATDTYDCLGRITGVGIPKESVEKYIVQSIHTMQGTMTFPYPPYSSKTVRGTPLFSYAKQNTLHTITVPEKTIHITDHTYIQKELLPVADVKKHIIQKLQRAPDGFRKEECIAGWHTLETHEQRTQTITPETPLQHYSATITGEGGLYVRAIVHEIGRSIGYPTTTTAITRTKIGPWIEPGRYTLPPIHDIYTQ